MAKRFARQKINYTFDRVLDLNMFQDDLTKQEKAFLPTFHIERLTDFERVHEPKTIFVCSMADLFGEWVPWSWQKAVFDACMGAPWHTYIFLTKNPMVMAEAHKRYYFDVLWYADEKDTFTAITWWGTTVNFRKDDYRIDALQELWSRNLFVSFEPLLEDLPDLNLQGIKQVIIGAQTNPFVPPPGDGVRSVVKAAVAADAKVFYKGTMSGVQWLGHLDQTKTRELCWSLHK